MCGVAGVLGFRGGHPSPLVSDMIASIRYRGPDDSGVWCDPSVGVGLGHARLSILDLSSEGHQPMVSASGRYVITFNGEVYNFSELRCVLEDQGDRFRGHSDTEVLLAAIEHWGVEQAISKFVGMFAFGLWDRETRKLHLVRDRLGIKPLYFGWVGSYLLFASELKAIRCAKEFTPSVDREALVLFMRLGYVPAPYSIYHDVYKLMPGCVFTIGLEQVADRKGFSASPDNFSSEWKPIRYWSARQVAENGVSAPFCESESDAVDQLDDLLRQVIKLRMAADVPLGAFLSGGIDSSVVVALMQAQSLKPVRTFTLGFSESGYDEAIYAKRVAAHLGTDHVELYVTAEQARSVIPRLPTMYDEPFGDSSQIPTFLVSELARRQVTVALSGDGGDELFAGYNRYFWSRQLWRRFSFMPMIAKVGMAKTMQSFSPEMWNNVYSRLPSFFPAVQNPGDKMHKLANLLTLKDPEAMYLAMVSLWREPSTVVTGTVEPSTLVTDQTNWPDLSDFTMKMMYLDLVTYLPDDILTKVDRASMAVGLEARVPLLDHRVVEFAWRLPLSLKIRNDVEGKWLLRQVLDRYVPKALIDRPKSGFALPIDHWLRGPLREWAESLLDVQQMKGEGFLNPALIQERWQEHVSGKRNWQHSLWNVLMFQAWLRSQSS